MVLYCKVCKKPISSNYYNIGEYAYKKGNKIYCSYKCMRKDNKESEESWLR